MVKNHKFIGLFQTVFYYWIRIVLFALFQIFCIGLVFLGIALADTPSSPNHAPTVLITQSVDESKLVMLNGNTRPEATSENDRGRVADSLPLEHMVLQLQRPPDREKALQQFIEELHDPASPNFHRWLTAQQFGQTFGLAQQDLDAITSWLGSHGFTVNVVYPSGMQIDFSGSAGQIRETFHTEIHYLDVKGVVHIANISDPQIPAALAPAVAGVVSLHDFRPRTMHKVRGAYTFTSGGYTYELVAPADLATIYNLNPLFSAGISGQGQTIVVIEDTDVYSTGDWNTFRSTFGLSSYSGAFSQVHPAPLSGSNNCSDPGVNADDIEAILDAEYASAAAPSAMIELASCTDTVTTFGGLFALQNLINDGSPPAIISISYGECEVYNGAAANAAYNSIYEQAVTEGVSIFVSAGDEGAASCDADDSYSRHGIGVSGFASTPYNVAVGGTDFGDTYANTNSTYWNQTNSSTYGSAKSYIPEIPWNDACSGVLLSTFLGYSTTYGSTSLCNSNSDFLTTASGSGGPSGCATGTSTKSGVVGGTCAGYSKPLWQSVVGNPSDGVRDIPDVSLFAANGLWGHYYPICFSDPNNGGVPCGSNPSEWVGVGGTSASAPIMAGIQALVNQKTAARQGNPNQVYYRIADAEYGQSGNSSCNSSLGNAVNSSCIFYNVTQGDMDVPCLGNNNCYASTSKYYGVLSTSDSTYSIAYGAAIGWNFATGIGSVNAYNLVNNWSAFVSTTYSLSGTISTSGGAAMAGVTVSLSGTGTGTTTTNSSGAYSFTGLSNGPYTVTPSFSGYSFSPSSINLSVSNANISGENFTGAPITYSISGTISTSGGTAMAGVTVSLSGTSTGTTTTNSSGAYSFTGLSNGSYTVTPSFSGYSFSPSSINLSVSNANMSSENFTGTVTYSISGTISTSGGAAMAGVTVSLSGTSTGTTTTNSSGAYSFTGLSNGPY
ncbi:MAG: carboxypeptidase regulatory-like domain-containing protein, partial [Dissulfurispiraceae bacterium]